MIDEHAKVVADVLSVGIVISTIVSYLPAGAALVSIIWGCIRIYETKTVQGWLARGKARRKPRK